MSQSKESLRLVSGGDVRFSLYRLPAQNAERILEPMDELIRHLEACLDVEIPQFNAKRPIRFEVKLDPLADLDAEEFEIVADERRLVMVARTVPAVLHAVYHFLETALGVRWLWPGSTGTVTPKRKSLSWPLGTVREKPDFTWRALQVGGAIYGDASGLDIVSTRNAVLGLPVDYQKQFDVWCRRNRFGGPVVSDGHRWGEIAPPEKYGETHPEYYALVDGERDSGVRNGKHRNQPCMSEPGVVELIADYAVAKFASEPSVDVFSVAFNDGDGNCECARCAAAADHSVENSGNLAELTNEMARTGRHAGTVSLTDLVIKNANAVAKSVTRRRPEKKLLTLLYGPSRFAPKRETLDPKVIGQFCVMGNSFWNEGILEADANLLQKIAAKVPELGIYEYYDNGQWPAIHRLFPELVEKSVRLYHDKGARYFASQPSMGFAVNGINYFVLGKLLWNRDASAQKTVADYCHAGFGPAAKVVESYLTAFADRWRDTHSGTDLPTGDYPEGRLALVELYPKKFLVERRRELREAKRLAGDAREIRKRIRFLALGLKHTRLYLDALRKTVKLYRRLPVSKNPDEPTWRRIETASDDHLPLIKAADKAWTRYWRFNAKHAGEYVFGDYWVNYRPGVQGAKDATLQAIRKRVRG